MWLYNAPPITVGEQDASTSSVLVQLLGTQSVFWSAISAGTAKVVLKGYRIVQNNSGATLAAGTALVEQETSGARNGKVTTTTVANDPNFAGTVPAEFGTNTVGIGAFFLMQIAGPGSFRAAQTTWTETSASVILGTATTAGYVQPVTGTATGTAAAVLNDIAAYIAGGLAIATNTVAATGAGGLVTGELRMKP